MTVDEMRNLIRRVDKAKPAAEDVQALQRMISDLPEWSSQVMNLTEQTYDAVLSPMVGDKRSTKMIGDQMRRNKQNELGYADASSLEKMLIDAVVLAWLRYTQVERAAADTWGGSHTLTSGAYWDKRLSAAQRRYLRAIETLARVRKLGPAVLQVNIAQQQIVNPPG